MGPHPLLGMKRGEFESQRLGGGLRAAIGEVDVVARRHQRPHDRGPKAPRAAGDEDAAVVDRGAHIGSAPNTRQVFWPPKPKEFDRTVVTGTSRAVVTTSRGIAGSGIV